MSNAAATAVSVTSSCVGPTPPEVKTLSKREARARTLATMSVSVSGTISMRRRVTPSARSSRIRNLAF